MWWNHGVNLLGGTPDPVPCPFLQSEPAFLETMPVAPSELRIQHFMKQGSVLVPQALRTLIKH